MNDIIGKWVQGEGQPYEGLWFEFSPDGTFKAEYEPMGITSSGTYKVDGKLIDMDQTAHTFGLVGEFKGRFSLKDDSLKIALSSTPQGDRPEDFSNARVYHKV